MQVTVAISTWNRADVLDQTLSSLAGVAVPDGVSWRVVVANNNSTDHTEEVLDRHESQLPLTRLFVAEQGKSHALNEIVDGLTGDLVLWTDDDVLLDEGWIAAYVDAARRWPEAAFFGGVITPRFPVAEPPWLRPAWGTLANIYGNRDLSEQPFAFDRRRLPFGANMAARVEMQRQYRYDPELGRKGELVLAGEETVMMQRWLGDGHQGMWVPDAKVEHLVPAERLEVDAIRRVYYGLGESKQTWGGPLTPVTRLLRGAWYGFLACKYTALSPFYSEASNPYRWMRCIVRSSYNWGAMESQWRPFPTWMTPGPIKRLKADRAQPRRPAVRCELPVEQ